MPVGEILAAPLFTLMQATGNGLLLIGLVPILAVLWLIRPKDAAVRRRLWWLLALSLPWIVLAMWTRAHWHDQEMPVDVSTAANIAAYGTLGLTLVAVVLAVTLMKGARVVAAIVGVLNLYLAFIGALLCVMATSGNWM